MVCYFSISTAACYYLGGREGEERGTGGKAELHPASLTPRTAGGLGCRCLLPCQPWSRLEVVRQMRGGRWPSCSAHMCGSTCASWCMQRNGRVGGPGPWGARLWASQTHIITHVHAPFHSKQVALKVRLRGISFSVRNMTFAMWGISFAVWGISFARSFAVWGIWAYYPRYRAYHPLYRA